MPSMSWDVATTMTRALFPLGLIALAACAGPDPNPLAWTATYSRPYEAMTSCLAQRTPGEYHVVPAIDAPPGIGGVLLTFRSSGQKAGEVDVKRLDDQTDE